MSSQFRSKLLAIEASIESQIKAKENINKLIKDMKNMPFDDEEKSIVKRIQKKWNQFNEKIV